MPVFSYPHDSSGSEYTEEAISQVKMFPESASLVQHPTPGIPPKVHGSTLQTGTAPRARAQWLGIGNSRLHCRDREKV